MEIPIRVLVRIPYDTLEDYIKSILNSDIEYHHLE